MYTKEDVLEYLAVLEAQIDPEQENRLWDQWLAFTRGLYQGKVFQPRREKWVPPSRPFPKVCVNEALEDRNAMALQQFAACSAALESGSGNILGIRCNYGSSILMSLFPVKIHYMADELDTLPTSFPMEDPIQTAESLMKQGLPDLNNGFGASVFAMGEYFLELMEGFPHVRKYVALYHPDCQGPFDACEVLIGSSLFYKLYDNGDFVKEFLSYLTETYLAMMGRWRKLIPYNGEYATHWGYVHQGEVMLRDDSAMNLSPDMFEEFILPYDSRILGALGGAVHFCGRGDHYIPIMAEKYPNLYAINLSQPHLNNMDIILLNTVQKGIRIIGLSAETASALAGSGRDLRGLVHTAG